MLRFRARALVSLVAWLIALSGCAGDDEQTATTATSASETTTSTSAQPSTTTTTRPKPLSVRILAVHDEIAAKWDATPEVTDETLDQLITFHFADDVTAEERASTREWMKVAIRYWGDRAVPATLWTGREDAWTVDAYVAAFPGARTADAEAIYASPEAQLGIAGPGAIVHQLGEEMPGEVLIHEYVHVMQAVLSGRRGDQWDQCWFTEGSATLYGNALAIASQFSDVDVRRYYGMRQFLSGPPLADAGCDNYGYNAGAQAVEYLWFRFGEDAVLAFFEASTPGVPWQDAVRTTFGLEPEQLQADFDAHRAELLG